MKIKDARSLPPVAQEDLRIKAVKAVLSGMKHVEAAKLFGVARQTVDRWVKSYQEGGFAALKARKQGRPRGGSLLPWQAAQIAKAVVHRHPDQLKLPFYLWTREAVADYIERRFGIRLSVWTVGRYLKRWGFTPQKPVRRAFEQNPKEVQRWLKEEYPAIRKQARLEGALIHWGDQTGLRSDATVGRTYGRRGHTPVIPGTGKRFSCSMISAITNQGHMNFMVFKEKFDSDVFITFLGRLIRQVSRKVFLIVDRHPVHRSGKVKSWLETHTDSIRMFYLPGYSPELNPDEYLNQDVKSNAVGRRRAGNQKELMKNVRSYARSRQCMPRVVQNYFQVPHVRYAAI